MKDYLGQAIDLTGDTYLDPVGAAYGDGSGLHQRSLSGITSISVHHDAMSRPHDYNSVDRYRTEAAEHYNRLGPGLQYHYKIDNVGQIFKIRPWTTWLYVVGSAENPSCLAICLDGNFENQQPTREQLEALYQLIQELCENHPEFPATWPDVRPHQSYSATACCGAHLRDRIYAITDKGSAVAELLNQGDYDWLELQPSPASTPAPVQLPTPPTVVINYRVKDSAGHQLGAFSVDRNAWQKYLDNSGSHIYDQNGNDVTSQLEAKFNPPVIPPLPPASQDHMAVLELQTKVSALEALLNKVVAFLGSIFNGFK